MNIRDIKTSLPKDYDPKSTEGVLRDMLVQMDSMHPVGSIIVHGGLSVPSGWLQCNGSAVGRLQYKALYAAIGVKYGQGDGSNTFNLPNLTAPTSTMYLIRV
jgi:hypothetical protein